eukprot:298426-Hanusia_phi.AAC.1
MSIFSVDILITVFATVCCLFFSFSSSCSCSCSSASAPQPAPPLAGIDQDDFDKPPREQRRLKGVACCLGMTWHGRELLQTLCKQARAE